MELRTIEGVELVSTGTYQAATGEVTFSAEDLAAAVEASKDPTITAPRIKLGHDDPRFAEAVARGELDGEPAFGQVAELRLSDDGQTVIGDLVNVPDWLADSMPSSYPGRSIEGGFKFAAPSGRDYDFVITHLALLGVSWPAVGCLEDLQEVLQLNGRVEHPIAAKFGRPVSARVERAQESAPEPTGVVAGIDLGQVQRSFCYDLDEGEINTEDLEGIGPPIWWWPRSVRVEDDGTTVLIVDDDEGHLLRIPFSVKGSELSYGTPEIVIETFVPVAAGRKKDGPRVLASWPASTRAARPSQPKEKTMDVDIAVLRQSLGLSEDADEAAVEAALKAEPKEEVEATKAEIPEGMTLVDEATLTELREGATAGIQAKASLDDQDRDSVIAAAIKAGKFPGGRREHYETLWAKDREGTRTLLTAKVEDGGLASGLIPVEAKEMGRAGDGDGDPSADDAAHEAYMARHFPQASRRLRGDSHDGVRVRTEV